MEEEDVYKNLPDMDFGGEVEKLKMQNQQLLDHIESLEKDIEKLCQTLVGMKSTQKNLEKNISELYNTARREIERKDQQIADLRTQLDDLILRRQGNKRPAENDHKTSEFQAKRLKLQENGRHKENESHNHLSDDHKRRKSRSDDDHRKSRNHDERHNGHKHSHHDDRPRSSSRGSKHGDRYDKDQNRKGDRQYDKHKRDKSREHSCNPHREIKKETDVEVTKTDFKCSIDLKNVGLEEVPPITEKGVTDNKIEQLRDIPVKKVNPEVPKPNITVFTERKLSKIDQVSKRLFENVEKELGKEKVRVGIKHKESTVTHKNEKPIMKTNPQIDRLKCVKKRSLSASHAEEGRDHIDNEKRDKSRSISEGRTLEKAVVAEKPKHHKSRQDTIDEGSNKRDDKNKEETKDKHKPVHSLTKLPKEKDGKIEDRTKNILKSKDEKPKSSVSSHTEKDKRPESNKLDSTKCIEKKILPKDPKESHKNKIKPTETIESSENKTKSANTKVDNTKNTPVTNNNSQLHSTFMEAEFEREFNEAIKKPELLTDNLETSKPPKNNNNTHIDEPVKNSKPLMNEKTNSDERAIENSNSAVVIENLHKNMVNLAINDETVVNNCNNNNNNTTVIHEEKKYSEKQNVDKPEKKEREPLLVTTKKVKTKCASNTEDLKDRVIESVMTKVRKTYARIPVKGKKTADKVKAESDKVKKLFYATDEDKSLEEKTENETKAPTEEKPVEENPEQVLIEPEETPKTVPEEKAQVAEKPKRRKRSNNNKDKPDECGPDEEKKGGKRVLRSTTRKLEEVQKPEDLSPLVETEPNVPANLPVESPRKRERSPRKKRVTKFEMLKDEECNGMSPLQMPVENGADLHNEESLPVLHLPETESNNSQNRSLIDLASTIEFPKDVKFDNGAGLKILTVEPHATDPTSSPVCILERLNDEQIDQLRDDLEMSFELSLTEDVAKNGSSEKRRRIEPVAGRKRRRVVLKMID